MLRKKEINEKNLKLNKKWQTINSASESSSSEASWWYLSSNLFPSEKKVKALYNDYNKKSARKSCAAPRKKFHLCELFTYFSNFIIFSSARTRTSRYEKRRNKNAERLNDFEMENNWIRLRNFHKLAIWPANSNFSWGLLSCLIFDGSGAH